MWQFYQLSIGTCVSKLEGVQNTSKISKFLIDAITYVYHANVARGQWEKTRENNFSL